MRAALPESHRREFLERTDRGVFSLQAEATLNQSRGFCTLAGRAVEIDAGERQVVVTIEYGDERERVAYELVVVAIGFDARAFEALLGSEARSETWEIDDCVRRTAVVGLTRFRTPERMRLPYRAANRESPG